MGGYKDGPDPQGGYACPAYCQCQIECEGLSERQYYTLEIQKEKLIPALEIEERVLTLNCNMLKTIDHVTNT